MSRRILIAVAWGLAGLAIAGGLITAAFALAGEDIARPATPIFAPSPSGSRQASNDDGTRSPEPSRSETPSPSDDVTPGSDDNGGSSGSDDNSGPGSDDSGSGSDNSGPGSSDPGSGSDDHGDD